MANKDFRISIKTLIDSGFGKVVGFLDQGIAKAKAFQSALRAGLNSAPVRALRNALAALVGTLGVGVMEAAKFNVQMARAWTMSKQGVDGFRAMKKEIIELSGELGIARDQLADGLYQSLSAGVPEDNVFSFLSTAARVAVADGSEVSVVVDGLTSVINAFKISADQTGVVADKMFKTVANGKTTFSELAGSIAQVAPVAASFGVGIDEVLASVATLTKQGTPTAQAMTQIRAAILSVNEVLGDGWAKTMSLQDAFKELDRRSGGSQNALREMLGTVEAVNAVLGMTGKNASMAASDLAEMGNAAGSLGAAFEKVDMWRHWPKLFQTLNGLLTTAGGILDERIAPGVLSITEMLQAIQNNPKLWEGFASELDSIIEQFESLFSFLRSEGIGGAAEIAEAAGQILLGYAQKGSTEAISALAKWMPLLGKAFADAAKDALVNIGERATDRAAADIVAEEQLGPRPGKGSTRAERDAYDNRKSALSAQYEQQLQQDRAIKQGESLAQRIGVGNSGDANIAEGRQRVQEALELGNIQNRMHDQLMAMSAAIVGQPPAAPAPAPAPVQSTPAAPAPLPEPAAPIARPRPAEGSRLMDEYQSSAFRSPIGRRATGESADPFAEQPSAPAINESMLGKLPKAAQDGSAKVVAAIGQMSQSIQNGSASQADAMQVIIQQLNAQNQQIATLKSQIRALEARDLIRKGEPQQWLDESGGDVESLRKPLRAMTRSKEADAILAASTSGEKRRGEELEIEKRKAAQPQSTAAPSAPPPAPAPAPEPAPEPVRRATGESADPFAEQPSAPAINESMLGKLPKAAQDGSAKVVAAIGQMSNAVQNGSASQVDAMQVIIQQLNAQNQQIATLKSQIRNMRK